MVDVNPRLTTSYVGLSRVAGFNVAEAMVNAVVKNKLPARRESRGFVYFSKVKTSKPSIRCLPKGSSNRRGCFAAFPIGGESEAVSLVAGHGESMADAQLRFEEAKKRLLNIIGRRK